MLVRKLKLRGQSGLRTSHIPAAAALHLTTYAPTVAGLVAQVATPTTRALVLTPRIPTVTPTSPVTVTPTTRALIITERVPTVGTVNDVVVTPRRGRCSSPSACPPSPGRAHQTLVPDQEDAHHHAQCAGHHHGFDGRGDLLHQSQPATTRTPGTIGSPWRTIAKFVAQASAGETLHCRGGTYTGQPEFTTAGHSGTAGNPITVRNHPGETPNFVSMATYLEGGTSYWVLDGLTISGIIQGSSSHVWVGNGRSVPGATDTHHMTIRNCNISKGAGSVETRHAIYLSHRCSNITVEYNTITGLGPAFNPGANATAGVHCHHDPMPTSLLIQRNIIRSWPKGIIFYSESAAPVVTGSILHNTFQNNDFHIDARHHSTLLVRDNVGDNSVSRSTCTTRRIRGARRRTTTTGPRRSPRRASSPPDRPPSTARSMVPTRGRSTTRRYYLTWRVRAAMFFPCTRSPKQPPSSASSLPPSAPRYGSASSPPSRLAASTW